MQCSYDAWAQQEVSSRLIDISLSFEHFIQYSSRASQAGVHVKITWELLKNTRGWVLSHGILLSVGWGRALGISLFVF